MNKLWIVVLCCLVVLVAIFLLLRPASKKPALKVGINDDFHDKKIAEEKAIEEKKMTERETKLKTNFNSSWDGRHCKNWVIITTIFNPTAVMKQFVDDLDWCLCIVGDRKSPSDWKLEGFGNRLAYLSATDQNFLPYTSIPLIPWNHFGRKNIGYLFAIQHGAKLIYDTDDDNILKNGFIPLSKFVETFSAYVEACSTLHLYNPYPEFGSEAADGPAFSWPRGFPLNWINDNRTRCYNIDKGGNLSSRKYIGNGDISVFQSLADNDPDVDSIYRMTGKIPFNFKKSALQVALPFGTMSPLNAQATLFKADAFWGLLLPVTVHGRVSDIWRSYILQRVLWEVGKHVAFVSPFVTQCRNSHNYLSDYFAERPLFEHAGIFIGELLKLDSLTYPDLPSFLKHILSVLYQKHFVEEKDVLLMSAWIEDLQRVGYQFPPLINRFQKISITNKVEHILDSSCENAVISSISDTRELLDSPKLCYLNNDVNQFYDCSAIFDAAYYSYTYHLDFPNKLAAWEHWNLIGIQRGYRAHAGKRIIKIVLMTKNEWPLIQHWVLYHGEVFGFKNIYILDASTDSNCINFLKRAQKKWGANVMFSQSNLNEVEYELDRVMHSLKASADFLIKMDTDEFLAWNPHGVWTAEKQLPTPYQTKDYLDTLPYDGSKYSILTVMACNAEPDCRGEKSIVDEATACSFPTELNWHFKALIPAWTYDNVDLGGHQCEVNERYDRMVDRPTELMIIHYHNHCYLKMIDICKRVIMNHGYITQDGTDAEHIRQIERLLEYSPHIPSVHKLYIYLHYLQDSKADEKAYYNNTLSSTAWKYTGLRRFIHSLLRKYENHYN